MTDMNALFALRTLVDEAIEVALVRHESLAELLTTLLPKVCAHVGGKLLFIETYGDDLALTERIHPAQAWLPERDEVIAARPRRGASSCRCPSTEEHLVAQPLDVAGAWFGRMALVVPEGASSEQARASLSLVAEVLDNHLFSIRAAREKQLVMMRVGDALRHRVLGEGLAGAVDILGSVVPLDRMVLVYTTEEGGDRARLQVRVFEGREPAKDPTGGVSPRSSGTSAGRSSPASRTASSSASASTRPTKRCSSTASPCWPTVLVTPRRSQRFTVAIEAHSIVISTGIAGTRRWPRSSFRKSGSKSSTRAPATNRWRASRHGFSGLRVTASSIITGNTYLGWRPVLRRPARTTSSTRLDELIDQLPAADHETPHALLERRTTAERISLALADLPVAQRDVFLLAEEGGLTLDEIAAATETGRETAKSRLRYALGKLRHSLRDLL